METTMAFLVPPLSRQRAAKPFLKWAGGKGQLIDKLETLFPIEMGNGKIKRYAEPFIGGGALFFYVAQKYPTISSFFISDVNEGLILAYQTIQRDVEGLIARLKALEQKYYVLDRLGQKSFFYRQREIFNANLAKVDYDNFHPDWIEQTAITIFLNRTCFNGLFRVNSKGEFNVPFGDYKNPKICDSENLYAVAEILQKTEIECGDFTASTNFVDKNTFVYFDPPYRPITKTANFTSYSKFDFGDDAQSKLSKYYRLLSERGAKLMLSNSDPQNENPQDTFFEDLYQDFRIEKVDASRMINCNGAKRGKIKELVILNY